LAVEAARKEAAGPLVPTLAEYFGRPGGGTDPIIAQRALGRRYLAYAVKYAEWGQHGEAGRVYGLAVDLVGRLLNDRPRSPELQQEDVTARNDLAWLLATSPDEKVRDVRRAVELARRAVEQAPTQATFWNSLGVARYRAGDWKGSMEALNW